MIAIHHGTPQAVDARLREAFVEHVCLVNDELLTDKEDLLDEKAALAEENDALVKETIALRHEIRQYALAEKHQTQLRQKAEDKASALATQLNEIEEAKHDHRTDQGA